VATGRERIERRVPLASRAGWDMCLTNATPDGRLLLAAGVHQSGEPTAAEQWLAKAPGLGWVSDLRTQPAYVLVDAGTGREVARGSQWVGSCTPDARYLLGYRRDLACQLWDVPPRRPWRWLLPAWGAWTSAVGLLGWRLLRRARRAPRAAPEAAAAAAP
jgi:hypothetical protein